MKKTALVVTVIALGLFAVLFPEHSYLQEKPQTWEVYFSPRGGCTEAIIKQLDKAKTTILIQAYYFTSEPIAKALLSAHKRDVDIQVILDKTQRKTKNSSATSLATAGITVRIDSKHDKAHDKVMIIDGEIVITGSFNFTQNAENNNAENLLIITDKKLAEIYTKNWHHHERHSEIYNAPGK